MLDHFNTTTFAHEKVSVTGSCYMQRSYSPRISILGPKTFSPEGHMTSDPFIKINDEPSNTVSRQVERMEEHVEKAYLMLNKFK